MKYLILLSCLIWLPLSAFADTRQLTDDTERQVTLPEYPKRIVVLHEPLLGIPILDFGGEIIGSYGRNQQRAIRTQIDFIDTVLGGRPVKPLGVGPVGQLNLEKIRSLQPDLIIGIEKDLDKVAQLSRIAPVYFQNVSAGLTYGYQVEAELAHVLNKQAAFEKRKADYQAQLADILRDHPRSETIKTYLPIIVHDQINLIGKMSGAIQALEDLGYQRAALTDTKTAKGGASTMGDGSTFSIPLSSEIFGRLNPDLLVIMNSYVNGDRGPDAIRKRLDKIAPGWHVILKPAKENRILYLDSTKVATPSIASAEHTLTAYQSWRDQTQK